MKLEIIRNGIGVYTDSVHRFGTDAILLERFAEVKRRDIMLDLCTGCGIIPILAENKTDKIFAVDIQEKTIELLRLSLEKFNIGNITPILGDLKNLEYREFFTLITCNPPYKKIGAGIESVNEAERIARHEVACTIDDICKVSQKLLKNNGRLCLCNRSERLADVIAAMRENKIEPKRLQFISKNENSSPWLFLIEGKKNSKPFLQILPQIYMKDGLRFSD